MSIVVVVAPLVVGTTEPRVVEGSVGNVKTGRLVGVTDGSPVVGGLVGSVNVNEGVGLVPSPGLPPLCQL